MDVYWTGASQDITGDKWSNSSHRAAEDQPERHNNKLEERLKGAEPRISQERFVGLRQSIEVSRMWGAHTKELVVRRTSA